MAIQFLPELTPGSQEWKEQRRKYITGTDIAPLMLKKELKPSWMATRAEIYLDKIGELPDKPQNAAMRRGTAMEDPTANRYAKRMGFAVYSCPMIVDGIFAANIDRLVAMPDAPAASADGKTITAKRILECKTASKAWGQKSPIYYYGQPQWYMGFLPDCESADIACWFGDHVKNFKDDEPDDDFAIYHHERNQEFIDQAREIATEFMEKYVKARVFPEPESEEECRIKWAVSSNLDAITATKEIEFALDRIHRIDGIKEKLDTARQDEVKKIMELMKDHAYLKSVSGDMLVSWKSSKGRTSIDYKGLLAKYYPDVTEEQIKEFTTVGKGSRSFKIL